MTNALIFSTDALPERDRFPAFCEEFARRIVALDIQRRDDSPFRATMELRRVKTIGLMHASCHGPSDHVRTRELMRDGNDALCIVLPTSGTAYQSALGEVTQIAPGEGVICDGGYLNGYHFTDYQTAWALKIPRPRIAAFVPNMSRFAGVKLDKDPVALRLLFGYLAGMWDADLDGNEAAAQLAEQHLLDLVGMALGATGELAEIAKGRGIAAARLQAIKRDILDHLGDESLSLVTIAERHRISPRYVGMLFERAGESFSAFVLTQRLAQAYRQLADWRLRERKISAIAYDCGFSDISYFNRAFRRHYGMAPSELRTARGDGP